MAREMLRMGSAEVGDDVLLALLAHFRDQKLTAKDLKQGYVGPLFKELRENLAEASEVDFDLAVQDLEARKLVATGPLVPHENDPNSGIFILGMWSKREYVYLAEGGYRAAQKLMATHSKPQHRRQPSQFVSEKIPTLAIHPDVWRKCGSLFSDGAYAEAVEKSFKIVRDRLRELTNYETGADAFGKGRLHVPGAIASHVEEDFNKGVQFLTMAIDRFRNEKSHTSDGNIEDPSRALQYMILSSLALCLLERATPRTQA
jgi:uncharacterized protein (TIGR02391 family)